MTDQLRAETIRGRFVQLLKPFTPDFPAGKALVAGRSILELGALLIARPSAESLHLARLIMQVKPLHTMVRNFNLINLYRMVRYINQRELPGAIVECGVWRGGSAAMMAAACRDNAVERDFWLFDSFEGLPPPTAQDNDYERNYYFEGMNKGSIEAVQTVFHKLGLPLERLTFVKGWFEQTMPTAQVGPIALLHIDADWYDSVSLVLNQLYDRVVPGGYVVFDDYGYWEGCEHAPPTIFYSAAGSPRARCIGWAAWALTSRNRPEMQARPATGFPWLRSAQIAGTLALSVLLARSISWELFRQSLIGAHWGFVALAALLLLLAHSVNLLRWSGLLPRGAIPPGVLTGYYGAGLFSSNFLPTGVGGDGVRAALAGRHLPLPQALLSVALDRGVGLAGLGFFLLPGLWLGLPAALRDQLVVPGGVRFWLLPTALLVGAVVAAGGALLLRKSSRLQRLLAPLWGRTAELPAAGRSGQGWASLMAKTYLLSVLSNLGTISAHWALLQGLGVAASPGAAIWVVLIGSLSMLLPISINGLGVLESVFVVVLAAYGVPAPTALAAALLSRALGMLFSLIGGLLSLRSGGTLGGGVPTPR